MAELLRRQRVNPDDVNPVQLGAMLATLPPHHPLVTAARLGIEATYSRHQQHIDACLPGGEWHINHTLLTSPLLLKRYPPTGDRATWVKYGPAGPPSLHVAEAA